MAKKECGFGRGFFVFNAKVLSFQTDFSEEEEFPLEA